MEAASSQRLGADRGSFGSAVDALSQAASGKASSLRDSLIETAQSRARARFDKVFQGALLADDASRAKFEATMALAGGITGAVPVAKASIQGVRKIAQHIRGAPRTVNEVHTAADGVNDTMPSAFDSNLSMTDRVSTALRNPVSNPSASNATEMQDLAPRQAQARATVRPDPSTSDQGQRGGLSSQFDADPEDLNRAAGAEGATSADTPASGSGTAVTEDTAGDIASGATEAESGAAEAATAAGEGGEAAAGGLFGALDFIPGLDIIGAIGGLALAGDALVNAFGEKPSKPAALPVGPSTAKPVIQSQQQLRSIPVAPSVNSALAYGAHASSF